MHIDSELVPEVGGKENSSPSNAGRFSKPKSFVETVADYLRESILQGEMKPGEKLNQSKVLEKLGISSIPFREALRILEKEGLLISRPGRGCWVAGISHKDLEETFEMREMIEVFALELIRKREKEGFHIKEMLGSVFGDEETDDLGPEFCLNFHLNLIQLADNTKLLNLYLSLSNNIRRYQRISYSLSHDSCVKEHLQILEPLRAGDYEGAKSAVASHLAELKSKILEGAEFSD
jgi:DNA-binding GntR family transcriptional regulator